MSTHSFMLQQNLIYENEVSWTIDNFDDRKRDLQSPTFLPFFNCSKEWCLRIPFNSYKIYLIELDTENQIVTVRYNISAINENGKVLHENEDFREFSESQMLLYFDYQTSKRNRLIVKGYISVLDRDLPNVSPLAAYDYKELSKNLKSMYKNGSDGDVTFELDGQVIRGHRNILQARSPAVVTSLDHEMAESKTNTIVITDVDFKVFDSFIAYLYSGEIENNDRDTVIGLYSLADKYDVPVLQKTCSRMLGSDLTVDNVCKVLVLADLHRDMALKEDAKVYLAKVFGEIAGSEEWKNIISNHHQLSTEIFSFLSTRFIA